MSLLNLFGSESQTQQTAVNQQVGASQGAIAVGANASGNRINVVNSDPAVAQAAIEGNDYVAGASLGITGQIAGLGINAEAQTATAAELANAGLANQAIEGNAIVTGQAFNFAGDVAGKSLDLAGTTVATSAGLAGLFMQSLQTSYQGSLDFASGSLTAATQAEQAALAQTNNLVSGIVGQYAQIANAQTPGGVIEAAGKTQFNVVLVVGAALVLLYLMSQKG